MIGAALLKAVLEGKATLELPIDTRRVAITYEKKVAHIFVGDFENILQQYHKSFVFKKQINTDSNTRILEIIDLK